MSSLGRSILDLDVKAELEAAPLEVRATVHQVIPSLQRLSRGEFVLPGCCLSSIAASSRFEAGDPAFPSIRAPILVPSSSQ